MSYIPVGKANPINAPELAEKMGLPSEPNQEELRAIIRQAIAEGELIGSNSSGYWIVDSIEELRVTTAAREGDMEVFEAFVSLQLRRIEIAHAEVEFRKALEREEAPHIGRKRRHGRELRLDAFAFGRNDRRMVAPVLFSVHLSVHYLSKSQ